MIRPAITDWETAYANRAAVPDTDMILAGWVERSAAYRDSARLEADLPYGDHPRERFDLFRPEGAAAGLVVFLHGGYWRAFDKNSSSHLARGPVARGWAVAVPSYPLCPEVRIAAITRSAARAVEAAAARVAGPVIVAGHSAGGHLATRLACRDAPLAPAVAARTIRCVGISGVYDLRPLTRTPLNDTLAIDDAEAAAESPALLLPDERPEIVAWVGAAELPAFRRQTALLAASWAGLGARIEAFEAPRRHHFDVIDPLTDPDSALVDRLLGANHHG
jgi:acetyl esterase/lipase